jgi:hypothetical protein
MSAPKDADDRLHLLLADADELRPVLGEGIPGDALQGAKSPKKTIRNETNDKRQDDAEPNDLKLQRWGVVVPEGGAGKRLLEAIQPLIRLREEEQGGAPVKTYSVPTQMSVAHTVTWMEDTYWSTDTSEKDRPRYLLLLGDLHEMQAELQHTLANNTFVGRIHFANEEGDPDLAGYAAYAEKVVRFAREGSFDAPDMAFFAAQDGTAATATAELNLLSPGLEEAQQRLANGNLDAAAVRRLEARTVNELLAEGAGERPSVLLSVTHGMAPPRKGWSEQEQRRKQGSLILDRGEVLDADRLLGQRFLPGGMWFCLACYGGGSPTNSAYNAWLKDLAEGGAWSGNLKAVLSSLPSEGRPPFVAAMPQAALRNPEGPLGVIGHMDLAWTYGYMSAKDLSVRRESRFMEPLYALARGSRAGVGLDLLLRAYRDANNALLASYQREKDASVDGKTNPTDPVERAHFWMLRNDLRGYVLLGDPAARLPLRKNALAPKGREPEATSIIPEVRSNSTELKAESAPQGSAPVKSEVGAPIPATVDDRVEAAQAMLYGDEAPRSIAARKGVSLKVLWEWVDAYRAGGREKLSK